VKKRRVLTLSAYENLQRTPASEENCTASTGPNKLNSSISKTEIKFWKRKKKSRQNKGNKLDNNQNAAWDKHKEAVRDKFSKLILIEAFT